MMRSGKCFWLKITNAAILAVLLSATQCIAAGDSGWSVGVGFVLSGFPGVAVDAAWHANDRLSVVGEVTVGLDTCDKPVPVVWLRSYTSYKLPVTDTVGARLILGLSQIRLAVPGRETSAANLLEVGLGGSVRLSERLDITSELRLAHFLNEKSNFIAPVGLQLGLTYRM